MPLDNCGGNTCIPVTSGGKSTAGSAAVGTLDWKESVRATQAVAATLPAFVETANTLTGAAVGALPAFDTIALSVGDRVLIRNEGGGTSTANGIFDVTDLGSGATSWILTRPPDARQGTLTANAAVQVEEGATLADTFWLLTTNDPITVGTTALTWAQFMGAANTWEATLATGNTSGANNAIMSATAAPAGSDSQQFQFVGVTSAASRTIALLNEADAGTDTYRLRINDNAGAEIASFDESGHAHLPHIQSDVLTTAIAFSFDNETIVHVTTAGAAGTLPAASGRVGYWYYLTNADAAADVTVTRTGMDTINGAASNLAASEGTWLIYAQSATNWEVHQVS